MERKCEVFGVLNEKKFSKLVSYDEVGTPK